MDPERRYELKRTVIMLANLVERDAVSLRREIESYELTESVFTPTLRSELARSSRRLRLALWASGLRPSQARLVARQAERYGYRATPGQEDCPL